MATKRLLIEELKTGMLLAEPVVIRNHVIQKEGDYLNSEVLDQIKKYGEIFTLNVVFHEPDEGKDDTLDDSEMVFGKKKVEDYTTEEKKVVIEKYVGTVSYMKNVFDVARQFKNVKMEDMVKTTKDTIADLLDNYSLVHVVKNLRGSDDYTYQHSVNVGVLAGIIGRWLKMDESRIQDLVLAGILHDIGKSQIPLHILNKPGKLTETEFAVMKQHTVFGYKILTNIEGLSDEITLAALQHHERIDGSGYPFGLSSEKISDFSKIIAVADTYDAVTTDRVYQPKRPPLAVMEILGDEMFKKMDARSCLSMLLQIRDSLQGRRVILKNGEEGTIIFVGKHGDDDLVVKTNEGRIVNIGKSRYGQEIAKYLG